MTDEKKQEESDDAVTIKLSKKMSKSALVAVVLAVLGFFWNKCDQEDLRDTNQRVEKKTFEYMQGQIDDLIQLVHSLDSQVKILKLKCGSVAVGESMPVKLIEAEKKPSAFVKSSFAIGAGFEEVKASIPLGLGKLSYDDIVQQAIQQEGEVVPVVDLIDGGSDE